VRLNRYSDTRILVVEDQPMNRQIAEELLNAIGIQVSLADIGQVGIDTVLAHPPDYFDAILMDVQMPVLDGVSATRALRAMPAYANLPIIALTAHTMTHERRDILDAGMSDHLGKPFDPDHLYALLARWIAPAKRHQIEQSELRFDTTTPPQRRADDVDLAAFADIDVKAALSRFGQRKERLLHWLQVFAADAQSEVASILEQQRQGDVARLLKSVHAFKGRSGMLGLTALQEATASFEAALKADSSATAVAWQTQFTRTFDNLNHWLAEHGLAPTGATTPTADSALPATAGTLSAATLERIDELIALAENNDGDTEDRLRAMLATPPDTQTAACLQHTLECVARFDFAAAAASLRRLKRGS
jgi:CheY-like chemotaxis protein